MAETEANTPDENTPEETPEVTVEAPEASAADETPTAEAGGAASSEDETPSTDAPSGGPESPAATRRERLEARRAERRAAAPTGERSLEDRLAARAERKATNARQRTAYRAKQKAKRAERRAAEPHREPDHAVEHASGRPKVRQGIVTSAKPDKTISVRIDVTRRHRRYGKILRTSSTVHVHDEANDAHEGDTVRVVESRPLSKLKRWRLVEVLERAK